MASGSSSIQVGDIVWVRVGNHQEEPGTVLKVDCHREEDEEESDGIQRASTSNSPSSPGLHDGIMVQLNVSRYRAIYSPRRIRPLVPRENEGSSDYQRASRSQSRASSASSSKVAAKSQGIDPDSLLTNAGSSITPAATKSSSAKNRNSYRSLITPSPNMVDIVDDSKPAPKRKLVSPERSVNRSTVKAMVLRTQKEERSSETASSTSNKEDSCAESPYFAKKTTGRVTPVSQKSSSQQLILEVETAATATKPRKNYARIQIRSAEEDVEGSDDDEDDDDGGEENADDTDDRPFSVDYAPTSRATCRRCDQVISKGDVRISHVPLFRGKPGYRVYRHLECALFDENIEAAQDVAGWRQLSSEDLEALALRVEESKLERHQEDEDLEPDELVQVAFSGEIRPSPPGLVANLLPFQVEGVSWMVQQELEECGVRGGILADEMGMGKTLQTIATILDHQPKLQHSAPGAKHPPSSKDLEERLSEEILWKTSMSEWIHEMEMNKITPKMRPKKWGGARAGTLVVCPVIALSQWKAEIEKFTAPNTLSVGIYHGHDRASQTPAEKMRVYDVVITTYQVLEADFRKMVSPNKVTCPNCGHKFKIEKLRVHLKYFCGEGAQRTEAQARQRRTADRSSRNGGPSSRGHNQKAPMTKVVSEKMRTKAVSKLQNQTKSRKQDSDSEVSIEASNTNVTRSRPSRSAAVTASRRLSASMNEWAPTDKNRRVQASDDDDSSFGSESEIDSESETDEEDDETTQPTKKLKAAPSLSALDRAREKQRQALEIAKSQAATPNKKRAKGKAKGSHNDKKMVSSDKKLGKKKFEDESDTESDSNLDNDDALANIDLEALVDEAMAGAKFSCLHGFCWWRVVLDEAHFIKSRASQTAAAAFSLTAVHRWCLSGTPLQNRVGELYSQIRFLRLDPMAHYFCRQCTCKSIHYRFEHGKCLDCGHRTFSHFSYFNKLVLNPIQRDGYSGDGRRAIFKLKNEVLDKCLLRRTKETRAEDMNLPPRIVTVHPVRLHPVEADFYNALYTQTKSSFDDYVAEGTLLNNYAHIFDLLTKMRQAVNHPYLIVYSKTAAGKSRSHAAPPVANGSIDCELCHEAPTGRVVSTCCGAAFCRDCVLDYLTGSGGEGTLCPSCRSPFTIDLNQATSDIPLEESTLSIPSATNITGNNTVTGAKDPSLRELPHVATGSILRRINLAEFATSTKIEVLIQQLVDMRTNRPANKALVFSQFVNMLDLVRWRLHSDPCLADLGLGVRILHGGMDVKSRDETLKEFREKPEVRILLMSLKAAGVALNLTVASECYLLDLWWNPAAELQAIDRTHRLGQYRPIRAVRFVAEGTVEERVLQLQEKKRLVFDGTVGRDAGSLKMLTVDDMKALFA